jgi:hypothetical protein
VNFFAGSAEGHDFVTNLNYVREANFVETLGKAQAAYFGVHNYDSPLR